jgi:hypothetical protein
MSLLSKFESGFTSALKYFPYVFEGAIAIQSAMPDAPNATKKQILLSGLAAGAAIGETIPVPQVQAVSAIIDAVVTALKASSLFGFTPSATAIPNAAQTITTGLVSTGPFSLGQRIPNGNISITPGSITSNPLVAFKPGV